MVLLSDASVVTPVVTSLKVPTSAKVPSFVAEPLTDPDEPLAMAVTMVEPPSVVTLVVALWVNRIDLDL